MNSFQIEGFIYIPLTLEVEGKTSIDLENNFMYFYVEDITSTSFWIKERMEYLLKGIKDSITHITPTVLSHYSNEGIFLYTLLHYRLNEIYDLCRIEATTSRARYPDRLRSF